MKIKRTKLKRIKIIGNKKIREESSKAYNYCKKNKYVITQSGVIVKNKKQTNKFYIIAEKEVR